MIEPHGILNHFRWKSVPFIWACQFVHPLILIQQYLTCQYRFSGLSALVSRMRVLRVT